MNKPLFKISLKTVLYFFFSVKPIIPFCEVCDIYKACTVINGSAITVSSSNNITFDFARNELDTIESRLDRMEYNASLNQMLFLGLSLKVSSDTFIELVYKTRLVR